MRSAGKISSGVWLCLALLLFGGAMVAVFYRAARQFTSPSASRNAFQAPTQTLRLITFNVHRELRLPDKTATLIAAGDPDYLFLQEVHGKRLPEIQRQLGGKLSASTYYPLQNLPDADNDLGNAILSKYPLENGRPIPNHMKGACGVWAVSVVDGRRFYVACMRLSGGQGDERAQEMKNFTKAWESQERPPIIAAVDGDLPDIDELLRLDSQGKWLASNHWSGKKSKTQDEMDQIEVVGKGGTSSKR